jgi:hypothetical protein
VTAKTIPTHEEIVKMVIANFCEWLSEQPGEWGLINRDYKHVNGGELVPYIENPRPDGDNAFTAGIMFHDDPIGDDEDEYPHPPKRLRFTVTLENNPEAGLYDA